MTPVCEHPGCWNDVEESGDRCPHHDDDRLRDEAIDRALDERD